MPNGVILAGGLATRLGPVFGGESKALIPVGGRPHLVDQVVSLRATGCERVVVVASPATAPDVQTLVDRIGLSSVTVAIQPSPRGAVNALRWGLRELNDDNIYLLFADTNLAEDLRDYGVDSGVSWIGVAPAPADRPFCWRNPNTGKYEYSPVVAGTPVTIGAYYLADAQLTAALTVDLEDTDDGLASFLTSYEQNTVTYTRELPTWLDVGDVAALRRARRARFAPRSSRKILLDDNSGTLTKYGSGDRFARELRWLLDRQYRDKPAEVVNLVPRVVEFDDHSYSVEYHDLPTLAELWFYRPGRPDVWADVFRALLQRFDSDLWWPYNGHYVGQLADERTILVESTRVRLQSRPELYGRVESLLSEVVDLLTSRVSETKLVSAHGDLSFDNILHSPVSGVTKLVGPRGVTASPQLCEYAALRASYRGGLTAIEHGLYSIEGEHDRQRVRLWPNRVEEAAALDEVLAEREDLRRITVAEGCILLNRAATPGIAYERRHALVLRGAELLREALA